jgi:TnpA family transposase
LIGLTATAVTLRHEINGQLNKGEQLHNLRSYLWFGGDGIIRKKQEKEQQVAARCLNLITNIVMVWNTVYIQQILKQLEKEGFGVSDEDLRRISQAPLNTSTAGGNMTLKPRLMLKQMF